MRPTCADSIARCPSWSCSRASGRGRATLSRATSRRFGWTGVLAREERVMGQELACRGLADAGPEPNPPSSRRHCGFPTPLAHGWVSHSIDRARAARESRGSGLGTPPRGSADEKDHPMRLSRRIGVLGLLIASLVVTAAIATNASINLYRG